MCAFSETLAEPLGKVGAKITETPIIIRNISIQIFDCFTSRNKAAPSGLKKHHARTKPEL